MIKIIYVALFALCVVVVALSIKTFSLSGTVDSQGEHLKTTLAAMRDSMTLLQRQVDSLRQVVPGLGEYMTTIQLHVAKLWFAARASNWQLAKYEHDELEETIETAEALHARKNSVDITSVLQSMRQTQLRLLDDAIEKGDLTAFYNAYSQTLEACNGCHRPAGYGVIHIVTPSAPPVSNQLWKSVSP